ncbi:hypothetical protein [Natrinema sp. DC36]|nr:hypothetical protein [Natrinema sp. DC36]
MSESDQQLLEDTIVALFLASEGTEEVEFIWEYACRIHGRSGV